MLMNVCYYWAFYIIHLYEFQTSALYQMLCIEVFQFCGRYILRTHHDRFINIKGALLGLRQFLETKNPLKMMKNAFYFILKAVFVLEIFKFLP